MSTLTSGDRQINPSLIQQALSNLVPAERLSPWSASAESVRSQLSQAMAADIQPACLVYPETIEELAEIQACAAANRWRVLPFGSGSKLHWGGLARGVEIAVGVDRLNRLVEHAVGDLTVTAEAGMRFTDLQATLAQAGQFLAIDPIYSARATLGGIVATADTGFLRQRYNGVRDMLIGISFVRSDGKVAKAGGRVVKNVAGYDLMKLLTGSWGTLGIVAQVTLRIYPVPPTSRTVILTGDVTAIAQTNATLLASGLTPTAIALLSPRTLGSLNFAGAMGLLVRFQSLEVSVTTQAEQLVQLGAIGGLRSIVLQAVDEQALWTQLQERMELRTQAATVTCKIGVLPAQAAVTLQKIEALLPTTVGVIHAGSGLGLLRFDQVPSAQKLLEMRSLCQAQDGFLSVLEAPPDLKQTAFDLWGYSGNAIDLMQRIKQQFDPHALLSVDRFLAGV